MKVPCNTHLSIVVADFLPLDDKASRTIPVKQFPGYVKLLHSDRDSSFEDHFQVIKRIYWYIMRSFTLSQAINKLPKGSNLIAKKQSNVPKNRFENICSCMCVYHTLCVCDHHSHTHTRAHTHTQMTTHVLSCLWLMGMKALTTSMHRGLM